MREVLRSLLRPAGAGDPAPVDVAPAVGLSAIFRRFWPDVREYRGRMVVGLVLVVLAPALDASAIWLFKVLVDEVLTPRDMTLFWPVVGGFLGLTVASGLLGFASTYLAAWIGENFLHRMRTRVFAHLQTLPLSFFDRRRLGDLLSRLTSDVAAIEAIVLSGVTRLVSAVVTIAVFTAVLFVLNWQLALVSMLAVPLFWVVARLFSKRIRAASREVRRRIGAITSVAEESLGNAMLVQAYRREDAEVERFGAQSRGSVDAVLAATRLRALFGPVVSVVEAVGIVAILGVGIWQLSAGALTVGGLLAFLVYLTRLYSPVRGLGQLSNTAYQAAAAGERIVELLDERSEVTVPDTPLTLTRPKGRIRFEGVGFSYPGTGREVLTGIDLTTRPGSVTAIVGPSGGGKTSLVKLLLRFYDPTAGRITLDGRDLRDLDPATLRGRIAVVLQETLLLDDTIAENIRAGRPDATDADVITAARAADAHEFVSALPDGYDTRVGQRGRLLSGGQRQRIAIARAMIRNARLLIMDEPTTSLDAGATERVLAPMRRLMKGRTTIVISHDLLTVADADQILHVDGGRITESGTHRELMDLDGRYAALYRLHHPPSLTAVKETA